MSDISNAIMDAAEKRIRSGGFNGFSFREIAADVGIKSSSVHYHFPTKEDLAAAVIRRYATVVSDYIDQQLVSDSDPYRVWTKAFRTNLLGPGCMCPAVVMGTGSGDLPDVVVKEVQHFYQMHLDKLVQHGLSPKEADEFLSTITGALVLANAFADKTMYDRATADLLDAQPAAKRSGRRAGGEARRPAAHGARRAAS
jgi:TetR/AcrR family transcriptional regulator, transcriptional repressor for nem operon